MLIAGTMVLFTACSPSDYSLGKTDVTSSDLKEGVAYSITHDASNPNIIYLKSLMNSKYQPLWVTPQGRSQLPVVTLKIAFPGTYNVVFGVETRGEHVYGDTAHFVIEKMCTDFINDVHWAYLTGGVGKNKTWYLDLDAAANCKYFAGPLYFCGTDDWWGTLTDKESATDYNGDGSIDSWSWEADWASNGSWLFGSAGAMDFGYMTFDLDNGANVHVVDNANGKEYNGTFNLNAEAWTLKLNDAKIIHDASRDGVVLDWQNYRVISLTENEMQLGVIRDNDPTQSNCLLVYNFISKDYSDNWTPK